MARMVSLAVLTVVIVFLSITFYQVIAPFLLPLFLAGVTSILCQPIYRYFLWRTNERKQLAAGLTTASVLCIVLIPLLVATSLAALQLFTLAQDVIGSETWNEKLIEIRHELDIDSLVARIQPLVADDRPPEELQGELQENLRAAIRAISERTLGLAGAAAGAVPQAAVGFLGGIVQALIGSVMFVISLYYFLADGPALLSSAQSLIPVHVDYQRQLMRQFDKVVRAVVVGTFLAAFAQGFATAIALYLVDVPHFFIILIVATIASLIPLTGAWLVWGPCVIWLMYQGSWPAAIMITLYGIVVVGTLDNVIRAYVLNTDARLHPLLAFISVLGGLQAMGLWGVFIGPIVASFLHALVQIFNEELKAFSREKFGEIPKQTENDETTPTVNEEDNTDTTPKSDGEAREPSASTSDGSQSQSAVASQSAPKEKEKTSEADSSQND